MTPLPEHKRLANLTYRELEARDKTRMVVLLPVGATEAHGPHLPLATDVIISEAMAERAAQRLVDARVDALVAPSMAYSVADFASNFAGTISIRAETATALLVDLGKSFLVVQTDQFARVDLDQEDFVHAVDELSRMHEVNAS